MKNNVESEALEMVETVLAAMDPEESESIEDEEVSSSETNSSITYDYTSSLENISNYLRFNSACLVALIILLGLLMGLKKHD